MEADNLSQEKLDQLLWSFAQTKDTDKIKYLIALGADVNSKGSDGLSPIWHAVNRNNLSHVKLFVSEGADCTINNGKISLLMLAVMWSYKDIIKLLLLNVKCDYNYLNEKGQNVLYTAVSHLNKKIIKLLIRYSPVNIDHCDDAGDSVLGFLCSIVNYNNRRSKKIMKLLLDAGANVNIQGKTHRLTPLMIACKHGNYRAIKLLLKDPNIDLDLKNADGKNALDLISEDYLRKMMLKNIYSRISM